MAEIAFVLVHGFGFDSRTWDPLELVFNGQRKILLSLPGFGVESASHPYSIRELAVSFWNKLDAEGVTSIHLAGHSMGGYVCLEMLSLHPARVMSLALLHSQVFSDTEEKKTARTNSVDEIKRDGPASFAKKIIPSMFSDPVRSANLIAALIDRSNEYNSDAWIHGTLAMRDRNDHTDTLRKMSQPVLFLMGEDDKAVPSDIALKQATIHANSEMHLYPGVGHMGMYEHTHRIISDLIGFYSRIAS